MAPSLDAVGFLNEARASNPPVAAYSTKVQAQIQACVVAPGVYAWQSRFRDLRAIGTENTYPIRFSRYRVSSMKRILAKLKRFGPIWVVSPS